MVSHTMSARCNLRTSVQRGVGDVCSSTKCRRDVGLCLTVISRWRFHDESKLPPIFPPARACSLYRCSQSTVIFIHLYNEIKLSKHNISWEYKGQFKKCALPPETATWFCVWVFNLSYFYCPYKCILVWTLNHQAPEWTPGKNKSEHQL